MPLRLPVRLALLVTATGGTPLASHLPVTVTHGDTQVFAEGMEYSHLDRLIQFSGRTAELGNRLGSRTRLFTATPT